jgi:hypothetical protein
MRLPRWSVVAACLVLATAARAQDPPLQWTLPSGGLLNGSKAVIESQPCCGASRGTVHNPDMAFLAKVSGMAARDGRILRLKLDGNRTFKLTDCDPQGGCDGEDIRVHRLVAWWPKQRFYVVSVTLYEESAAYLVSQRDGRVLATTAPPVLSPSGRWAVALVSNLMSGVDLELLDLGREPPTLHKITEMPACRGAGPASMLRPKPVWIDDSQARFEGVSPQPGDNPNTKQLLRIVDGKPRWEC